MKYNKMLVYPLVLQFFAFFVIVTFNYFKIGASEFYDLLPVMLSAYLFSFVFVFLFIYFNEKTITRLENELKSAENEKE